MIRIRPMLAWTTALLLATAPACRRGDESYAPARAAAGDRLAAVADGVVVDQRSGLQWTSHDHDRALPWEDAERHCRTLALGGWTDWRLPDIEELRALYDTRLDEPCGDRSCHVDPAIRLSDAYVWSASAPAPGARFYFDFAFGNSLSPSIGPKLLRRVLCVRRGSPG